VSPHIHKHTSFRTGCKKTECTTGREFETPRIAGISPVLKIHIGEIPAIRGVFVFRNEASFRLVRKKRVQSDVGHMIFQPASAAQRPDEFRQAFQGRRPNAQANARRVSDA
jgi:hypothetical protein